MDGAPSSSERSVSTACAQVREECLFKESVKARSSHRTWLGPSRTAPCGKSLARLYLGSTSLCRTPGSSSALFPVPRCWGRWRAAFGDSRVSPPPWQDGVVSPDSNTHKTTQGPFSHAARSPVPMVPHRTDPNPQLFPSQRGRCPFKSCRPPLRAPLPAALIGRPRRRSPPVPVSATLPCWRQSQPPFPLIGPRRQCLWRPLARARPAPPSWGRATPSPAWPLLIGREGSARARWLAAARAAGCAARAGRGAEAAAGQARGVRPAEDGPGAGAAAQRARPDRECRPRDRGRQRPREGTGGKGRDPERPRQRGRGAALGRGRARPGMPVGPVPLCPGQVCPGRPGQRLRGRDGPGAQLPSAGRPWQSGPGAAVARRRCPGCAGRSLRLRGCPCRGWREGKSGKQRWRLGEGRVSVALRSGRRETIERESRSGSSLRGQPEVGRAQSSIFPA